MNIYNSSLTNAKKVPYKNVSVEFRWVYPLGMLSTWKGTNNQDPSRSRAQLQPVVSLMKSLARSVVWLLGPDTEFESKVKSCEACQVNSRSPPKSPLHPWEWLTRPSSYIHVDFCGPFLGKIILFLIVDAHSKWLEMAVVSSTSSQKAILMLRQVFAVHGLPEF